MERRFSNQRLKYWVSTVAAVIDPTLPSPVASQSSTSTTAGAAEGAGVAGDPLPSTATASVTTATTSIVEDDTDENSDNNHGTYVPPQVPPLPVYHSEAAHPNDDTVPTKQEDDIIRHSDSPNKNELDHQQHPPTITSHEEVLVFDSTHTNSSCDANTNSTSNADSHSKNHIDDTTPTHAPTASTAASSILFPRLQTWKKQATEAVLSATTTASTSSTGTVTTATATAAAAAAKASALMKQTSSWTTTTFATTKTKPNEDCPPVVEKESHVHMEIDDPLPQDDTLEEKKDDVTAKRIIHLDDQNQNDQSDNTSKDHPHKKPLVTSDTVVSTIPTNAVSVIVAEESPIDSPKDRETVLVESNDPPVTLSSPSSPVPSPPPSSPLPPTKSSVSATTMSLSSTFRSSLQQWSTSVSAAAKSSIVDNNNNKNNNNSTISSLGLPKDVFRGRYSMTTTTTATTATEPPESPFKSSTSPPTPVVENQSVRIGKLSSTADHWNQLSSQLQPHEYILLLGRGMLGVNLKQCYKLHHGVYVDYLVPHGSADRSKLVSVGDVITTVGKTDCLKNGTIATIPSIIANTARPVHITFATSGCFSTTNVPNPSMNYLDIAVALLHLASTKTTSHTIDTNNATNVEDVQPNDDAASAVNHDQNEETTNSMTNTNTATAANDCPLSPVTGESNFSTACSDETIDTEDSMSLVQPTSFDVMNHHDDATGDDNDTEDIILPDNRRIPDLITTKFDIDHLLFPQSPPPSICQAYMSHVAKRNIDPVVFTLDYITATYHCSTNVRCVIQNALIVCIADRRRLAFIHRFIERQQEDKMVAEQELPTSFIDVVTTPLPAVKKWNVLLSLFMEMYNFVDLYEIIPLTKQRDIVKRIAYKYFLPTVHDNQVQSPPYDFHTIVSDASIRKLESTLKNTSEKYPRTIFVDFQQATFVSLTESVFLPFVISNDCARMRAYLRHTAPYVYAPISTVLSSICGTDELSSTWVHAQNYLSYCLVYLLCMMEQEEFGENDDLLLDQGEKGSIGRGARVENAASAICAAIRIKRQILPAISETQVNWNERDASTNDENANAALSESIAVLMVQLEQLWEIYVAPGVGSLVEGPNPTTAVQSLQMLRSVLLDIQKRFKSYSNDPALIDCLIDPILFEHLNDLANELIHDYAVRLHPRFRVHKFHEWVCDEIMQENMKLRDDAKTENNNNATSVLSTNVPAMGSGCVKRLLRKATFPVGITPHQPSHDKRDNVTSGTDDSMTSQTHHCNADCAIVFGTRLDNGDATTDTSPIMTLDNISRYACQSVHNESEATQLHKCLSPNEIPVTLESYAYVPLSRSKPFKSMQNSNDCSADDWEISLVNFMLPHTDASSQNDEASSIYGVSLMFQYQERPCINGAIPTELSIQPQIASAIDASPVSTFDEDEIESDTSEAMNWFDRMKKQQDKSLQDGPSFKSIAIGLVLVAQQNHIFAMRESLSLLLQNFSSQTDRSSTANIFTLINRLGDLANSNTETPADSLRELLEPFLLRGSQPWIERPIGSQAIEFSNHAGQQMIQSLPPIPMALMFITALLEQKIVITSNRRSLLLSVTTALQELLNPLQWCHLILAHVPAAMASDLLQYPAPFILGLPSSDPGITEMLRELPPDITLIDLDIGRVILAPSFGHDVEFGRRSVSPVTNAGPESNTPTNTEKNIKILRSQVLYLAQCMGNVFGNHLYPSTWCCDDSPVLNANRGLPSTSSSSSSQFSTLRTLCHNFIEELLAGTTSCCYWLEEAQIDDIGSGSTASPPTGSRNNSNTVATVLFDEDQFFHVKDARYRYGYTPLFPKSWMNGKTQILNKTSIVTATTTGSIVTPQLPTNLALSMNEFDYIIELLLRCQSMNVYIGTRQRSDMAYFTK